MSAWRWGWGWGLERRRGGDGVGLDLGGIRVWAWSVGYWVLGVRYLMIYRYIRDRKEVEVREEEKVRG